MSNERIIVRRSFPAVVAVPADVLADEELSFAAKGLYGFLHTLPEGHQVTGSALAPTEDGARAVDLLLAELDEAGYLEDLRG
jgi:hypothetical protein